MPNTQIANLANNVVFLPQAMTWFERIDAKKGEDEHKTYEAPKVKP